VLDRCGRGLRIQRTSSSRSPSPSPPFNVRSATGATTIGWLVPPIRARDQADQRPSLWPLDARWDQSNRNLICWNIRGLWEIKKYHCGYSTLTGNQNSPHKPLEILSFPPGSIQNFITIDEHNASPRGLLMAWNSNRFKLISSSIKSYSITTQLELEVNATLIWISNDYGPNLEGERSTFFQEIKEIADQAQGH
jgi:hypothetical protein